MDGSQKYYSECNKPYVKAWVLELFIWNYRADKTNLQWGENQNSGCLLGSGGKTLLGRRKRVLFGSDGNVMEGGLGCTGVHIVKTPGMHFRSVHFIYVWILHQNKETVNKYWTLINEIHAELSRREYMMSSIYFEVPNKVD